MEISLRKSKALQTAIRDKIEDLNPSPMIIIDAYSKESDVDAGIVKFEAEEKNISNLIVALYEIREQTAVANVECGVSSLLTEVQKLEAQMNFIKSYANSDAYRGQRVIESMLDDLKSGDMTSDFGRTVTQQKVSVVSQDSLDEARDNFSKCKALRIDLLDQIQEKNSSTNIELSSDAVEVLRKNSLI